MHGSPQSSPLSRLLRRAERAREDGEFDQAERHYSAALETEPSNFDALHGLGLINLARGRLDAALSCCQAALQSDLGRADGFASLGLVFHALRQFERALVSYDEALRLAPDVAEAHNRRGVALLELRRPAEALAAFERALTCAPDRRDAGGNRANALLRLNRVADAVEAYEHALRQTPDSAPLLANYAAALRRLDRPHEALESALQALAIDSSFAHARFVESVARLTLGDFAAGWRAYESRWRIGWLASQRRTFAAPLWLGRESLAGKTILLHAEQGLGDTLQFVRYVPLLAARGATVILEVQQPLMRLLAQLKGAAAVFARQAPLPPYDFHCPLMSLPLALETTLETIPADIPYLAADPADVAAFARRLPRARPRVGLVWSGERSHDNDLNRSMPLATLAPLFHLRDIAFVSLQHEVRDQDRALLESCSEITALGSSFRDFADTAAAIEGLDAVVAVDTAVAHLAGAIGKPLFLMLPFAADFRWLRQRSDSPWYPTAKLFRQPRFGDWDGAVATLCEELAQLGMRLGKAA